MDKLPNPLIAVLSDVLSATYTHSELDLRLMEAGVPGDPPVGTNKTDKCRIWLSRLNVGNNSDVFDVLGILIEEVMEYEPVPNSIGAEHREQAQVRINKMLDKYALQYQMGGRIVLKATSSTTTTNVAASSRALQPAVSTNRVFVIYGQNKRAYHAMVHFLQALGLAPWDFYQLSASMGGSPFVGDIVAKGLAESQATIALFTPDEYSELHPSFRGTKTGEEVSRWQARPNVIYEAGMAMGLDRHRTVIVTLGSDVSLFSDVSGIHIVRLSNDAQAKTFLRNKLVQIGCPVDQSNTTFLDAHVGGDFESCIGPPLLPTVSVRSPFDSNLTSDADAEPIELPLMEGDKVRHPTFGVGIITGLSTTSDGKDTAIVKFDGGYSRTLVIEYAKLKLIVAAK